MAVRGAQAPSFRSRGRARVLLALLVTVAGVAGCRDWRTRVQPGLAVAQPQQTPVSAEPVQVNMNGVQATLTPRADYHTKAWVVATDDGFDDGLEAVMTQDVSLAWGPLGNPSILDTMSFHLARRYVSVRWTGEMPLSNEDVMQHLSNHHLVPATEALGEYLEHVRPGDLLELQGQLVDVAISGGRSAKTSLRRDDIGNGACEILWVRSAQITRL